MRRSVSRRCSASRAFAKWPRKRFASSVKTRKPAAHYRSQPLTPALRRDGFAVAFNGTLFPSFSPIAHAIPRQVFDLANGCRITG